MGLELNDDDGFSEQDGVLIGFTLMTTSLVECRISPLGEGGHTRGTEAISLFPLTPTYIPTEQSPCSPLLLVSSKLCKNFGIPIKWFSLPIVPLFIFLCTANMWN